MAKKQSSAPAAQADRGRVRLPLVHTELPIPASGVPYYLVVGALVAFELIEWPVGLVVAAGHALATQSSSRAVQEAGEGAEAV